MPNTRGKQKQFKFLFTVLVYTYIGTYKQNNEITVACLQCYRYLFTM